MTAVSALRLACALALACALMPAVAPAQSRGRALSGTVITARNEAVAGARVTVRSVDGDAETVTSADGAFRLDAPDGPFTLEVAGENLETHMRVVEPGEPTSGLLVTVAYVVPPIHESVVIVGAALEPAIDLRDETVYEDGLFARDDQIFHTLAAGINAGQHEGGGKSLEVRRFGFNLDHGGVNGGLKVLVDDVQQNHTTQGHGQGYLGQLKSLTPELVKEVTILNGPFSAQYGDFSGLGVVHVQLRESLPDVLTLRVLGGAFDTFRSFLAYSPKLERADAFLAYEASRSDGPFANPLDYSRDNVTASYTRRFAERHALGVKLNFGRNDFTSSGQIPLDEVSAGRLDRFGFLDPDNGGRVQSGVAGIYYRRDFDDGTALKADGYVARSLFDLFSNFTFFLGDETDGDEVQQHDSRLVESANVQLLRPYRLFGRRALLTAGANLHDNQIFVGLWRSRDRAPYAIETNAHAHVTNGAGYIQQAVELFDGHLHVEGGLRFDAFRFAVDDLVDPALSGVETAGRLQPKASVAWTVSHRFPATLYLNYGRGIASQDARGVVRDPRGPKVSTTDFYQVGSSVTYRRLAVAGDLFLIDRSNEQVYIPDDGSIELAGPSRAYGWQAKGSVQLTSVLSLNGGVTRVGNAYFRATDPVVYVDSAPHTVADAALTLADWHGFRGSVRYRHASNYRLDGRDPHVRASGHDVVDLSAARRLAPWLDLNLQIDNLTNKRYWETQNYFASRLRPGDPAVERIHATPGYPLTLSVGVTLRLFGKE